MGKRCIYGPKGESFIIDDKAEIPEGFGVDPELIGKEKEPVEIKPIASKKKTNKKSN